MKTIALPKFRLWRLLALCLASMLTALSIAAAQENFRTESTRLFWVAQSSGQTPNYRQLRASLHASGKRSAIYVENKLWGNKLSPDFMNRLLLRLESELPDGASASGIGIVPLEEALFGPLPPKSLGNDRLIVLFADLGVTKTLDTAFSPADQLSDSDAQLRSQRSNEANILYVNGFRENEEYTAGAIARGLQQLLSQKKTPSENGFWLAETIAEGAMLLTGHFTNQPLVNEFASDTGLAPLVSSSITTSGPQLLFSSFLLDSFSGNGPVALAALAKEAEPSKTAVEKAFREQSGVPHTFDAIFSKYVSYVFDHSGANDSLPRAWQPKEGIVIPKIRPYYSYRTSSGELIGQMPPYTFLAIDLVQELSPHVLIQAERLNHREQLPNPDSCASSASVLWKPITPKRIAVYSVGCDPLSAPELVSFSLKILDQPSLLSSGLLKILP